jgi:uncharacterized delta-60 repeat protein
MVAGGDHLQGDAMHRSLVGLVSTASLVVGLATTATGAVAREGDLDPAFDGDGIVTSHFGAGAGGDFADEVVLQPDGKAVVAGESYADGTFPMVVARYRTGGSLDPGFGDGGAVLVKVTPNHDYARCLALYPDGRILVGGATQTPYNRWILARLGQTGDFDPTFSGDGKLITDWGVDAVVSSCAIQPDGKLVVAGYADVTESTQNMAIARYTLSGKLDTTFGDAGKVLVGGPDDNAYAEDVAIAPDGSIYVAGGAASGADWTFAIAKLSAQGAPVPGFGVDGTRVFPLTGNDGAESVVVQADGRIVAGGYSNDGGVLVRLTSGGATDASFGMDGIVAAADTATNSIDGLALQRDGRILAATTKTVESDTPFTVSRFNRDGSLDATFGEGGTATLVTDWLYSSAESVAIGRNGRIVAVGSEQTGAETDFVVARFFGDLTAPYAGEVRGLPRWSTSLRPQMYWSASDDNTGVKAYDVRQRVAKATASSYGAYSLVKSGTQLTAGSLAGATGRTSCVSVRGRDWAGNIGAFGTESCVAFPVDDKDLAKTGQWTGLTGKAFYAGTARRSDDKGATLSLAGADYRHLALVADKCPGCGTVKVYRGSTLLATVKLTAGSTRHRVVIPIQSSLTTLSGTIKIKVTSDGKPVTIDGLGISLA